jgi:hypothetical protein
LATVEQILAAADRAEKAGDAPAAKVLRDRAAEMQAKPAEPSADQILSAANRAKQAGDQAAYDVLMARLPAAAQGDDPLRTPRADPDAAATRRAFEFAAFEAANPGLAGRYTPDDFPAAGESVMGTGGGGRSGGARVTVQPSYVSEGDRTDAFGGGAAMMAQGPLDAMRAFGGGLIDTAQSPSFAYLQNDPAMGQLPAGVNTVLSKIGDIGGAALSALGAGVGGAAGLAMEAVPGLSDQGESELAQSALLGAQFAVPELAGASSVASRAAGVGARTAPKAVETAYKASVAKPSVDSLRAAKTAAYKAVDEAGETFDVPAMAALRDRVKADLSDGNYVPGVDTQTDAVVSLLDRKADQPMTLGQLDKLRQEMFRRLAKAPNEVGIRDAIDAVDEMIASNTVSGGLMEAARLANSRYKKVEMLDLAFQKAADQTASTGSGGNILNKFRQAVTSIIDNPKRAKWFSADEIATMRAFVQGTRGENALRLVGKLSPDGNGLMMALNLFGASVTGGMSLGITAAAVGAKALADSGATRASTRLMGKVSGASAPAAPPRLPARGDIIVGPVADLKAPAAAAGAQDAANANQRPAYEALFGRY